MAQCYHFEGTNNKAHKPYPKYRKLFEVFITPAPYALAFSLSRSGLDIQFIKIHIGILVLRVDFDKITK